MTTTGPESPDSPTTPTPETTGTNEAATEAISVERAEPVTERIARTEADQPTQRIEPATADSPTEHLTPVPADATRPQPTAAYSVPRPTAPLPEPATAPVPPAPPENRGPRSGTVVWGLIVTVFGIGIFAAAAGFNLDVQLALIVLLAAAGVALLVGSTISAVRRKGREEARTS